MAGPAKVVHIVDGTLYPGGYTLGPASPVYLTNGDALQDNLSATGAPTVNDDSNAGYSVGSVWIDIVGGSVYICADATPGAANWVESGGGSGTGDITNGASVGAGVAVFKDKSGTLLRFRSISTPGSIVTVAASGDGNEVEVDVDETAIDLTAIDASGVTGILESDGANVAAIADGNNGDVLTTNGAGVFSFQAQAGGGDITGGANVGAGTGVFGSEAAGVLNFRSITSPNSTISSAVSGDTLEVELDVAPANINIGDLNNAPTGDVVGTSDAQTLTNKTLTTPTLTLKQSATPTPTAEGDIQWDTDNDKIVVGDSSGQKTFSDDSVTSGIHGVTGNFVGTSDTQTLTGKTMDADNNTFSNFDHGAEVNNPSSGVHGVTGSVVGTTDTQTLTNKTITEPVITLEQGAGLAPTASGRIGLNTTTEQIVVGDGSGTGIFSSDDVDIVAQSGGSYTLALTDASTWQDVSAAATVTVPPNASVAFKVGTIILINRNTSGAVALAAGAGVTINSENGLTLNAQNAVAGIMKTATNTWVAFGSLTT